VAKVNDFIELYSAPPLSTGRNHAHSFPEPDPLRVIIRVTKFEKGEGTDPNFIYWKNFVEKSEPDPSRDGDENEHVILRAINDIGADAGVFTPSEILAEATGIPVQDVKDHLELLAEQGKVKFVVTSTGSAAYMQPRGRLYLKEVAMAKKQSKSAPRRIFISHGKSGDWREVQDYVQREVGIETLELAQEPFLGRTILQKLDDESNKCGYAVIIMTGDDPHGDELRARENVIHEIGFFQGRYGLDRVCLLYEQGVNIPSNIHGLGYVQFPTGLVKAGFADLRREIEAAFR
jgi:predicted nucleotide-binding protein